MATQHSRILIKRSTLVGEMPTVPASNNHLDGSWLNTDIYEGEIFINVPDKKVYSRSGNVIYQISGSDASNSLVYRLNTLTQTSAPASGQVVLNNVNPALATIVRVNNEDVNSTSRNSYLFNRVVTGDKIIFAAANGTQLFKASVTSVTNNTTHINYGVTVDYSNIVASNDLQLQVLFDAGGSGGAGNFIPLTGTVSGKPVTGSIEFADDQKLYNYDGGGYKSEIYAKSIAGSGLGTVGTFLRSYVVGSGSESDPNLEASVATAPFGVNLRLVNGTRATGLITEMVLKVNGFRMSGALAGSFAYQVETNYSNVTGSYTAFMPNKTGDQTFAMVSDLATITKTLQSAYNDSAPPKIDIDNTRQELIIKSARGLNTDKIQAWANIAGTQTAWVDGNGEFNGASFVRSGANLTVGTRTNNNLELIANNSPVLRLSSVASGDSFIQLFNANSGVSNVANTEFVATGSPANIGITFTPKGVTSTTGFHVKNCGLFRISTNQTASQQMFAMGVGTQQGGGNGDLIFGSSATVGSAVTNHVAIGRNTLTIYPNASNVARIETTTSGATIVYNAGVSDTSTTSTHVFGSINSGGNASIIATAGNKTFIRMAGGERSSFQPTSGNATIDYATWSPNINQTGGANGQVSLIFLNPTQTSLGGVLSGIRSTMSANANARFINHTGTARSFFGGAIDLIGKLTTYNGNTTIGNGVGAILGTFTITGRTTAYTSQSIMTIPATGIYKVTATIKYTTGQNLWVTNLILNFTSGGVATTHEKLNKFTTDFQCTETYLISCDASSALTFSTVLSGATNHSIIIFVERIT